MSYDTMQILGQTENIKHLELAATQNLSVLLIGDTGCGKTTMVQECAKKHGKRSVRFNLTGETTVDEFVGKYMLEDKRTVWQDGILLKAMKEGAWLVVDEINVALPEILFVLHSLLDDDRAVTVAQHDAEIVRPHEDFRFFATMNPVDEYSGTKDLNKAFLSRFPMILRVDYPKMDVEAEILQARTGISAEDATTLVAVGRDLRKLKEDNKIFYTCSTRDLLQWASLVDALGVSKAFSVTVGNKAGTGDQAAIDEVLKKKIKEFKSELKAATGYSSLEEIANAVKELEADRAKFEEEKKNIKEAVIRDLVAGVTVKNPSAKRALKKAAAKQAEVVFATVVEEP